MGRPKKGEREPGETRERLYQRALELFAQRGFEAVSVRDITRSLGLNEATLYLHYKNKAALLEAIFTRLEAQLIDPGFRVPPPEALERKAAALDREKEDPAEYLVEGARRFYQRAGREVRLTWRLLMISQFRYEAARRSLETHLLDTPVRFFTGTLESLAAAGRLPEGQDWSRAGRILADLFFNYSFRSNLKAAWGEDAGEAFERLAGDIRFFLGCLMDRGGAGQEAE